MVSLTACNESKTINLYNNLQSTTDDNLIVRYELAYEFAASSPVTLSFYLCFTNKNPKPFKLTSKSVGIVYRERDKAEYKAHNDYDWYITLECDVEEKVNFNASLPTKTSSENYYFVFKYNSTELIYHFYDLPSSNN